MEWKLSFHDSDSFVGEVELEDYSQVLDGDRWKLVATCEDF